LERGTGRLLQGIYPEGRPFNTSANELQQYACWNRTVTRMMVILRFAHAPWSLINQHDVLISLPWSCSNLPLEDSRANPVLSTLLDRSLEL
jgi:hypothetical protein